MIAALEAKIESLKVQAERKKVTKNPALRSISTAVKAIDKALAVCEDQPTRRALDEARATLNACLMLNGVVTSSGTRSQAPRGRRGNAQIEDWSRTLFDYVKQHPGQRGEQIAAALGTDVLTMRRPMKALIGAGRIRTEGQRRGMTYHIG